MKKSLKKSGGFILSDFKTTLSYSKYSLVLARKKVQWNKLEI